MAGIALDITNLLLAAAGIGTSIGIGLASAGKVKEYREKLKTLTTDAKEAGNLYDHTYYMVAVNHNRVLKAVQKLPDDFVEQVQNKLAEGEEVKALNVACEAFNYTSAGLGAGSGVLQIIVKFRKYLAKRRLKKEQKSEEETKVLDPADPFNEVPVEETPEPTPDIESLGSGMSILAKGLAIGGIVFGVAGLGLTLGVGISELKNIDDAISAVEKKQAQVDGYKKAMAKALNVVVKAAGFPSDSYDQLVKMAGDWRNISENFDSYEKTMDMAIEGYYQGKTADAIKKHIENCSDHGKPFPHGGYTFAKALADDIKCKVDEKKTAKEIVSFFATENPEKGLRVVFDEFFISNLINPW